MSDGDIDVQLKLALKQYGLAKEFPGEHVVFCGEKVLFHSKNENEALIAYGRFAEEDPATPLTFIGSEAEKPFRSVSRGRN